MTYSTIFIDLDGTLYSNSLGLWQEISTRMNTFMHKELNLPLTQVPSLREEYFQRYGTTLRGIQANYEHINAKDFLAFVHDVPVTKYLKPDPELRNLLTKLSQPKWIFTNADKDHAQRILDALDIADLFEGIVDVQAMNFIPKPNQRVYETALNLAGNPPAQSCILIDDLPKNLAPAKSLGFFTILVGENNKSSEADLIIPKIHNLPSAFPALFIK
jgi:pyrimidine 5'-nucleotidase